MIQRAWTDQEREWEAAYRDMLRDADNLHEVIFLALGAASACWTNLEGAGTFESTRASLLGNAVLDELERRGIRT